MVLSAIIHLDHISVYIAVVPAFDPIMSSKLKQPLHKFIARYCLLIQIHNIFFCGSSSLCRMLNNRLFTFIRQTQKILKSTANLNRWIYPNFHPIFLLMVVIITIMDRLNLVSLKNSSYRYDWWKRY